MLAVVVARLFQLNSRNVQLMTSRIARELPNNHVATSCLVTLFAPDRKRLVVIDKLAVQPQGVVTPIGPVLTTATAVKLFDRPKRALTV